MNHTGIEQLSTDELVRYLAGYAKVCSIATDMGDSEINNLGAKRKREIYRVLRSRGRDAHAPLRELLKNDDPSVRTAAAIAALEFSPKEAEQVLVEVAATEQRFVGFNAQILLSEWRKGT